jgi:hypothetical protein
MERKIKAEIFTSPIDDRSNGNDPRARGLDDRHRLECRPAGSDHVLDQEYRLPRLKREATTQGHHLVLTLGKAKREAKCRCDLVTDQDTSERGRNNGTDIDVFEKSGK